MKVRIFTFLGLLLVVPCGAGTITPSPHWKYQIGLPHDPFLVAGDAEGNPGWVKFTTLLLEDYDPNTVYFQNSREYVFHYNFASELLNPFIGMSRAEYDRVALYEQGQQAVLGAVITPAGQAVAEYGIQFIRHDPYAREEIRDMFNRIKAGIIAAPHVQAFYFPTYAQRASAEADRDWFAGQGIVVSAPSRWARGNACYSSGWALGRLRYFTSSQIEGAYLSGDLLPSDILLTDGVPAEIPYVAGILSLSSSTPNSHVAILARTFSVPFAHLAIPDDADQARQLVGRTVLLRVGHTADVCNLGLRDLEGLLTEEELSEILALKTPPPLDISPTASYAGYSANTDALLPRDIKHFGGKASNFGILRRAIPNNSPVATALSFDLWHDFLDQTIAPDEIAIRSGTSANTLCEEIDQRLAGYSYPPSDMAALSADLGTVRDLIKHTGITGFTPLQRAAVENALLDPQYAFDQHTKLRFRSSTNVEDSGQFTGAGLYSSYSACLADELDADDQGPCACDPDKSNERGVFRAIRKVFASFYNDNAFLERLRHHVNETDVGMALLVHHSFPDEIELANGVATLERRESDPNSYIMLVTQDAAVSITNPQDDSIPEEVRLVHLSPSQVSASLVRSSNLVVLGETVMDWQDDYTDLAQLLVAVADAFEQLSGKTEFILDFEYKKLAPGGSALSAGGLVIKQVREIPQSHDPQRITTAFLVGEPTEYCTFQGESGNVFANHRLKSRWTLQTKNLWLTQENLEQSLYADAHIEYAAEGRMRTLSGTPALWPFASHAFDGTDSFDGWLMHDLQNTRAYELRTDNLPAQVGSMDGPVVSLSDFGFSPGCLRVSVAYDQPVPSLNWMGLTTTTTDTILLCPCPRPQPGDLLQERHTEGSNGVSITSSFYWPPPPEDTALYTAPLKRFVETVIQGYTTEPIVLQGYYSQTYWPEHHNWNEFFIFEPQLEPGIAQKTLEELRAQNIRFFLVDDFKGKISTYGLNTGPFQLADVDGNDESF